MNWQKTVMSLDEATDWGPTTIDVNDRALIPYSQLKAQAKVSFKLGQEEEAKGGHNAISYLMGQEEERKKWIKGAIKAGILISNPEELAGIITTSLADICLKHRKAGIREVVEWIEEEDAIDRMMRERWQTKLRGWGIK